MNPVVSIIIPNYNHPEIISVAVNSFTKMEGVPYEVVVVDNGSTPETVAVLQQLKAEGKITTLVLESVNRFFSGANNAGVAHANPASEYILLQNSDVAIRRGDFLVKLLQWMNGVPEYKPDLWGSAPTVPTPGPRDIVSVGWSWDANVPGLARPEGFCCMIRRSVWQDMSEDFPFHYGFEEAIAKMIRAGATAGVLSQYSNYLVHREGGSGKSKDIVNKRQPDMKAWFEGLSISTLDFSLGPNEHSTYLAW